jgi:hypothetical protein
MSLAHALGKTRRELLNGLDSYELEMWIAYLNEIKKMPENTKQKQDVSGTLKNLMVSKSKRNRKHA